MLLLSDLCLIDNDKGKTKRGVIDSKIIYNDLYKEAKKILNIYDVNQVEYFNYNSIIFKFFEHEKFKSWLNISDGKCVNFNNSDLEKFIYRDQEFYVLKSGSEIDFKLRIVNERKYINFLKTCFISLKYLGKYNFIGFGEVNFNLLDF
jgi:hypothetical protein